MDKLKKLFEFEWPDHLDNPLAIFEVQINKLWSKEPLFFENASKEEIQQEVEKHIEKAKASLVKFEDNEYKSNKVIALETADDIRFSFRDFCIVKNISEIKFEHFEEFAKQFNINNNTLIEYDIEPERLVGCEDDYIQDYKENNPERLKRTLYQHICEVETDIAGDEMPRQWDKYIKYFDAEGKQIISRNRKELPTLNYYEEDVIKELTKDKEFTFAELDKFLELFE